MTRCGLNPDNAIRVIWTHDAFALLATLQTTMQIRAVHITLTTEELSPSNVRNSRTYVSFFYVAAPFTPTLFFSEVIMIEAGAGFSE